MLFDSKKFEIPRYGPKVDLKNTTDYLTPDLEDFIEVKENLRDLGVIMSEKGTFSYKSCLLQSKPEEQLD
jgi:hypothetical protein